MTLLSQMTIPLPPNAAHRSQETPFRASLGLKFISPFLPLPRPRLIVLKETSFRASPWA